MGDSTSCLLHVVKVQSLRRTVTKGDKKKRREVNEDIARMEKEMEERHAREQHELEERAKAEETVGSKPVAEGDHPVVPAFSELSVQEPKEQPKLSKAQKRRVSANWLRYGSDQHSQQYRRLSKWAINPSAFVPVCGPVGEEGERGEGEGGEDTAGRG